MESTKLDQFDIGILRRMCDNGRISVHELSQDIGLSPTPTARRLRRLEQAGIIAGYGARINEVALGFDVSVFVSVRLARQVDEALAAFECAIMEFPEVVDCWLMTGDRDYMMRVVTRDLREFEAFLSSRLTKVDGVSSIRSSIPLRRVKSGPARTP